MLLDYLCLSWIGQEDIPVGRKEYSTGASRNWSNETSSNGWKQKELAPLMKRRIMISVLGGFAITAVLGLLSAASMRFFPYRDLPMMPKPFFVFALSPGLMTTKLIGGPHWIHEGVFWSANIVVYAIGVYAVDALVHLRKSNRSPIQL